MKLRPATGIMRVSFFVVAGGYCHVGYIISGAINSEYAGVGVK
jgi:hypothetical protein